MSRPEWVEACEKIIADGGAPRDVLRSVMEKLDEHGFLDSDWYTESDGVFD